MGRQGLFNIWRGLECYEWNTAGDKKQEQEKLMSDTALINERSSLKRDRDFLIVIHSSIIKIPTIRRSRFIDEIIPFVDSFRIYKFCKGKYFRYIKYVWNVKLWNVSKTKYFFCYYIVMDLQSIYHKNSKRFYVTKVSFLKCGNNLIILNITIPK